MKPISVSFVFFTLMFVKLATDQWVTTLTASCCMLATYVWLLCSLYHRDVIKNFDILSCWPILVFHLLHFCTFLNEWGDNVKACLEYYARVLSAKAVAKGRTFEAMNTNVVIEASYGVHLCMQLSFRASFNRRGAMVGSLLAKHIFFRRVITYFVNKYGEWRLHTRI